MSQHWIQVSEDGFGYGAIANQDEPPAQLFRFAGDLYASNNKGLFMMDSPVFRKWEKAAGPPRTGTISNGPIGDFCPLGDYLYCLTYDPHGQYPYDPRGERHLWYREGRSLIWNHVTSIQADATSTPMTVLPLIVFQEQVYGIERYLDATGRIVTFRIWRSRDIGKTYMKWHKVVDAKEFDFTLDPDHPDPEHPFPNYNHDLSFMGEFDGKLYAGTKTLEGHFREVQPNAGVGIWESPSGDPRSWTQRNKDGFGTEYEERRINHVIGSWAVYRAANQDLAYLYVGTNSHQGAEVWRYDGSGRGGWTNVTPPWAGLGLGHRSKRNNAMVVFQNALCLAEGYPGSLAKYDGVNWTTAVGYPPFHPWNGGFSSAAVHDGHLYVYTIHDYNFPTKEDQVWGYPYKTPEDSMPSWLSILLLEEE